jgi:hypothetical protein
VQYKDHRTPTFTRLVYTVIAERLLFCGRERGESRESRLSYRTIWINLDFEARVGKGAR